jgi:hypothetical protein
VTIHLPRILAIDAVLGCARINLGTGNGEERLLRQTQEEIAERGVCE